MGAALVNPQAMGDPTLAMPLVAQHTDKALIAQRLQIFHSTYQVLLQPHKHWKKPSLSWPPP
jgi:CHASE1-domain containing sensor protein